MKDLVQDKMGKSLDPICFCSFGTHQHDEVVMELIILSNSVKNVNYLLLRFLEAQSQISN